MMARATAVRCPMGLLPVSLGGRRPSAGRIPSSIGRFAAPLESRPAASPALAARAPGIAIGPTRAVPAVWPREVAGFTAGTRDDARGLTAPWRLRPAGE